MQIAIGCQHEHVWLTQNYRCVYNSIETAYSIKPTCLKTEEFHHKSNCQPVQEEFKSLYFSHNNIKHLHVIFQVNFL